MADRMAQAWQRLRERQRQRAASPVTYARGNDSASGIAGTRGRTDYQVTDDAGFAVEAQAFDWLIDVADLTFGAGSLVPARGDLITDDGGVVYEVLELPGMGAWRYSDPQHLTYRIHTKRVS